MLGISLGLFFLLTLQYRSSSISSYGSLFPLHPVPFSFFVKVSQPSVILQEPITHMIIQSCFGEALILSFDGKCCKAGILVCVCSSFTCTTLQQFCHFSSPFIMLLNVPMTKCLFAFNLIYHKEVSFSFSDCKISHSSNHRVHSRWTACPVHSGTLLHFNLWLQWVRCLVICAAVAPELQICLKSLPIATVIVLLSAPNIQNELHRNRIFARSLFLDGWCDSSSLYCRSLSVWWIYSYAVFSVMIYLPLPWKLWLLASVNCWQFILYAVHNFHVSRHFDMLQQENPPLILLLTSVLLLPWHVKTSAGKKACWQKYMQIYIL